MYKDVTLDRVKNDMSLFVSKHFVNVTHFVFYDEMNGEFKFRGYTQEGGSFHITHNFNTGAILVTIMNVDIKFNEGDI